MDALPFRDRLPTGECMPGAYAHMTLVNLIADRLRAMNDMPSSAKIAYNDHFAYCELGSVSPDYPYLAILDGDSAMWADNMHYINTGDVIRSGTRLVGGMPPGGARDKRLAWLLGYAAHVVTDVTIHPIVELKVGPYEGNEREHRVCELHQDAHIYRRLNLGVIGLAEHLDSGLARCHASGARDRIDPAIGELWSGMLEEVYPGTFATNPPDINKWHESFIDVVDKIEDAGNLLLMARHTAVNSGLVYPAADDIDIGEFIEGLTTPEIPMDYDDIFERAMNNVATVWTWISRDVDNRAEAEVAQIGNWNLDTGRDENGVLVFWEAT